METDQPLLLMLVIGACAVVAKWWRSDYLANLAGQPLLRPLPGATPAPRSAHAIAVTGAIALVAAESVGEHSLGLSQAQSKMTVLFAVHTLAAAFLEELIFRGYLVPSRRTRGLLIASAIGSSLAFAFLHPFLWSWQCGSLHLQPGPKAWYSTTAIFLGSLWFYFVRFMPANPRHSLLPCVTAHVARNLSVFAVKLAQGHISGWW